MTIQLIPRSTTLESALQSGAEFLRTVGAFAVALALESLATWLGVLELDPLAASTVLVVLTALLRAVGAWLRGPDTPAEPIITDPPGPATAAARRRAGWRSDLLSIPVPVRRFRLAFFLPF